MKTIGSTMRWWCLWCLDMFWERALLLKKWSSWIQRNIHFFSDVMTRVTLRVFWLVYQPFNLGSRNRFMNCPYSIMPIHTVWAFTQQKPNEIESEMGTSWRNSMKGQTPPVSYVLALLVHHNALFGVFQLFSLHQSRIVQFKIKFCPWFYWIEKLLWKNKPLQTKNTCKWKNCFKCRKKIRSLPAITACIPYSFRLIARSGYWHWPAYVRLPKLCQRTSQTVEANPNATQNVLSRCPSCTKKALTTWKARQHKFAVQ